MLTFTNDCLIGITQIDDEHKRLFELIAQANEMAQAGGDSVAQAIALVQELKEYAAVHFAHEEAYMEQIKDKELARQRKEHALFAEKVNTYDLSQAGEEDAKAVVLEILEFLSHWLFSHILGSDTMIGHFVEEKLAVPVFDDSFKTGIEIVDEEHKTLFAIIGKIHEAIQTELVHDKYDVILDILDELKEYTRVHFADEEEYMRQISYDGLDVQQMLHQKFIERLDDLDMDDVDDNQEAYLYDFLGFLQNWLVQHILKVDKLIPVK